MVKFLFCLVFSIPLLSSFWLIQWLFFFLSMFFLFSMKMGWYICISNFLGVDYFSFFMILLSLWICSLMMMASEKLFNLNYYSNFFAFSVVFLLISLFFAFLSMNLFLFYLFFEVSLVPTLFLIIGWGYQPERIEAGMYLLFYTLLFSLPMMVGIFYLFGSSGSMMFWSFLNCDYLLMYICMNMVFMVKMPMFFVHLWLPKAHVEASISGSMILAGVLLKLGGYGMIRLLIFFPIFWFNMNIIFVVISLVGGVLISFICLRQNDLKSLIAYSSVVHMGMVLAGLMTLNFWGLIGAFILMVAHGLCSSGLFCLANISYERVFSRSFYLNKGLINLSPSLSFWWFMFCICNMSAPPSINLLGEIFIINSLVSYNWICIFMLVLISFFSAVYSLFMYSYIQHGLFYFGSYSFQSGNLREFLLLFLHWFPLNLFILKGDYLLF
uniref:NADH-ubiquinone oxidoreductase chain 4 n=1 Tax=Chalcophana sp. N69 TaxID=2653421 RepID=A0A5Q0U0M8_9CUCU|nr:NADH dehydrogenase subunit 4 [Chalcophana sp. N69]